MADLPDLDTTTISYLAYYNGIDQGGMSSSAWDVSNATSCGNIVEYTVYDNGIEGTVEWEQYGEGGQTTDDSYRYPTGGFRVKSDGWVLVWLDRSTDTITWDNVNQSDDLVSTRETRSGTTGYTYWEDISLNGPYDMLQDWAHLDGSYSTASSISDDHLAFTDNYLFTVLDNLLIEMDDGNLTYTNSDFALYNYMNSSATTVTHMLAGEGEGDGAEYPNYTNFDFLFTSGTTIHEFWAAAGTMCDYGSTSYKCAAQITDGGGTTYNIIETDHDAKFDTFVAVADASGWVTDGNVCSLGISTDSAYVACSVDMLAAWS